MNERWERLVCPARKCTPTPTPRDAFNRRWLARAWSSTVQTPAGDPVWDEWNDSSRDVVVEVCGK